MCHSRMNPERVPLRDHPCAVLGKLRTRPFKVYVVEPSPDEMSLVLPLAAPLLILPRL